MLLCHVIITLFKIPPSDIKSNILIDLYGTLLFIKIIRFLILTTKESIPPFVYFYYLLSISCVLILVFANVLCDVIYVDIWPASGHRLKNYALKRQIISILKYTSRFDI